MTKSHSNYTGIGHLCFFLSNFCLLLSSYAPHISEELWSKLGNKKSICYETNTIATNDKRRTI